MDDAQTHNQWPTGKVGYVALLGRPNTGKSTFLNSILEFHLAAVSRKPQTTRKNCLGVLSEPKTQIIFVDAPGVHVPEHELDQAMERAVEIALEDADVVLCMLDPTRSVGEEDRLVVKRAQSANCPVFVLINKCDIATDGEANTCQAFVREALPTAPVYRVSAQDRASLTELLDAVKAILPDGPFLYPQDTLTDTYERDIGAELIREALLEQLREEVPHSMAVIVDRWKDQPKRCDIDATLYVERSSQKGIVIGQQGVMLKKIRSESVRKLRELCKKPIRLKLWVKEASGWRSKKDWLQEFNLLDH